MFIGIDLGGTKTSFAIADSSGKILAKSKSPSGLYDGTWLQVLASGIDNLAKEAKIPVKNVKAIGIGAPDLTIEFEGKKAALRDSIKIFLEKKIGIPVLIENDANAAALGEFIYGAGRGKKNLLYLALGTGIGGAAIIEGRLFRGMTGRACEFGHMSVNAEGPKCGCGNVGCLHLYASGDSIAKRALRKIAEKKDLKSKILQLVGKFKDPKELAKKISAEIVLEAAKQGDPIAKEVLTESLAYLGVGLVNLINIFNPEIVVIGGGLAAAGDVIFVPLNKIVAKGIRKELFGEVRVVPSSLGEEAGVRGALSLALRKA